MSHTYDELIFNIIIPPKPEGMDSISIPTSFDQEQRSESYSFQSFASSTGIGMKNLLSPNEDLASSKLPFVWKLHEMLHEVQVSGKEDIVSWIDNGRGFKVHSMERFINEIVPKYFRQSKYKSFQRQLYFYGFQRITSGDNEGAYAHPKFVKGVKALCLSMIPKKNSSRRRLSSIVCSSSSSISSGSNNNTNAIGVVRPKEATGYDGDHAPKSDQSDQMLQKESIITPGAESSSLLEEAPVRRCSSSISELGHNSTHSMSLDRASPSDGDTVFLFGGKPFHFVDVEFGGMYPRN